ncbi:MAG: LexA family transcriptional regulator [Oscillibacter sp.]|nr:LexA family transcriptional regulator [Oscillibacter sp.]
MSFGQRLRDRRKELGISQGELAKALGVSLSAVSNYENGQNAMREDVLLRLFRVLQIEPNYLYQDAFTGESFTCSVEEERLVRAYRSLRLPGKQALRAMADTLTAYQSEMESDEPEEELRQIPLYRTPAAAGYASPVFGEDFDYIPVTGEVPQGAEFAVRIQGDSMEPHIRDGSVVYVNRDPLSNGDVGIFCVDGDMLCKQYVRDPLGIVYLFSLNRKRADADVVLPRDSGRTMACFGRVLLASRPKAPGGM